MAFVVAVLTGLLVCLDIHAVCGLLFLYWKYCRVANMF